VYASVPYREFGVPGTGGSFYELDKALSVLRNQLMHYAAHERRMAEDASRRSSSAARRTKRLRLTLEVEIRTSAIPSEAQAAA
jgi:hypothetical protein